MLRSKRMLRLILQFLFTLLFLGPPIFRVGRPGAALEASQTILTGSHRIHIASWLLAGVVAVLVLASRERFHVAVRLLGGGPQRLYVFFIAAAGLSTVYSLAPVYTAFFASKLLVSVVIVLALASLPDKKPSIALLDALYVAAYIGVTVEVALLLVQPDLVGTELAGIGFRLYGGIFGDYGAFTSIAGLGLLVVALYGHSSKGRVLAWIGYGFTWYLLILTRTRSSIIAAAAILAIMMLMHSRLPVRLSAGYVAMVGLFLLLTSEGIQQPVIDFVLRGQTVGAVLDLSGRADAFSYGLEAWQGSPWFGYGFGGGSTAILARYASLTGLGIGAAHDAVSKVLLDLGLLGASLLSISVLWALGEGILLLRRTRGRQTLRLDVVQCLALLAWTLARSVVSGGVADVSLPFVITLVALRGIQVTEFPNGRSRKGPIAADSMPHVSIPERRVPYA